MQRSFFITKCPNRRPDCGYVLLYLLFLVAVLTISLATIVPTLKFTITRDREQEMVHRGEQYRRAIRRYYRRMGSYPATLDVLENTNDMRFLRKRYKDPMNHDKDFKTLSQIDLMKAMGTALAGAGGIAGAQTLGQPIGSDANATSDSSSDANAGGGAQVAAAQGAAAGASTTTAADPNSANQSQPGSNATTTNGSGTTLPFTTISGQPATQTGGLTGVVGVASLSGAETIRIYNKKNHYKDWLFIYDPTSDRGGLLTGPYQPLLQTFGQGVNGQNAGANGFNPGGINSGGFNSGMNNGMSPGMNTPGTSLGMPMQH